MIDLHLIPAPVQSGSPQAARAPRKRVYPKRVPSALTVSQREEALGWLRAGRSVHTVAYELSVSEAVILEIWMRSLERQMMRRAA